MCDHEPTKHLFPWWKAWNEIHSIVCHHQYLMYYCFLFYPVLSTIIWKSIFSAAMQTQAEKGRFLKGDHGKPGHWENCSQQVLNLVCFCFLRLCHLCKEENPEWGKVSLLKGRWAFSSSDGCPWRLRLPKFFWWSPFIDNHVIPRWLSTNTNTNVCLDKKAFFSALIGVV